MKNENANNRRALSRRPLRPGSDGQTADEYVRMRDLPPLIAMWPGEIADQSQAGTLFLIGKLKNALRAERQRGRAGHWSYDLGRHMGLAEALKAEISAYGENLPPKSCYPISGFNAAAQTRPGEKLHTKS